MAFARQNASPGIKNKSLAGGNPALDVELTLFYFYDMSDAGSRY
ncbi:MAG: hypothetical protein ACQ9MH_27470 [Nitrospinales bacterium]